MEKSIDDIMNEMNDRAKAEGRYLGMAFWEIPREEGSILDVPSTPEAEERLAALRSRRLERRKKKSEELDSAPQSPDNGDAFRVQENQPMILTDEEISFLDAYCHEGTERPFGGPATDVLASIAVRSGDTLNLQWAYLRDKPPTGPIIGKARKFAPPLPWANREAVLRRDAEIGTLREKIQRERHNPDPENHVQTPSAVV